MTKVLKKGAGALLLAMLSIPALAASDESWTASDKAKHVAATAVVSTVVTGALADSPNRFWYGVGAGLTVGVAKEVADRNTTGFSGRDLAADFVGAVIGAYFVDQILRPVVTVDAQGGRTVGVGLSVPLD